MMQKFSNAESWEIYCAPQTKKEKQQAAVEAKNVREAVGEFILANLTNLKVRFASEEGETVSSLSELETAISLASTAELQIFLKKKTVPFEDGAITVSLKKKEVTTW